MCFVSAFIYSTLSAQQPESLKKSTDEKLLPYANYLENEIFELDNGLRVIVHEDNSSPLVSYALNFHVGSKDEPEGKNGFAHLFEHLLFAGTKNNPGEYFNYLAELGGTGLNATTNVDFTNYFGTVPKGAFERVLWIEADRILNTVDSLTEKVLKTQIDVVKNEKGEIDNQPFGTGNYETLKAFYPANHPYSKTTIGTIEDLESANFDDIFDWYKRYYGARNIVLSIAGDVETDNIKKLVTQYFSALPAGPALVKLSSQPVKRNANTIQRNYDIAENSEYQRAYLLPATSTRDGYLAAMAAEIFARGKTSYLSQALVDKQKLATYVSGRVSTAELNAEFTIRAVPAEGVSSEQISVAVDKLLNEYLKNGATQEDLTRKVGVEKASVQELFSDNLAKALSFGENLLSSGDSLIELRRLSWLKSASTNELGVLANEWLSTGYHEIFNQAISSKNPPKEDQVLADKPPVSPMPEFSIPEPAVFTLDNGLQIVHVERSNTPNITLSFLAPFGESHLPTQEKLLANYFANLINESALPNMSRVDQLKRFEALGLQLGQIPNYKNTELVLRVDRENFNEGFELWADLISNAEFLKDDLGLFVNREIEFKRIEAKNDGNNSEILLRQAVWGDEMAVTTDEHIEFLQGISVDKLLEYHKTLYQAAGSKVFVIGDIKREEIESLLNSRFKTWQGKPSKKAVFTRALSPKLTKQKFIIVNVPDSTQTNLTAVSRLDIEERLEPIKERVANDAFGGNFTSRLNLNIREDKGWTYGIRSYFVSQYDRSFFRIGSTVTSENTADTINEIIKEMRKVVRKKPLTKTEITQVTAEQSKQFIARTSNNESLLSLYLRAEELDKPYSYYEGQPDRLKAVTAEEANAVLRDFVNTDNLVWSLIGNADSIEQQIKKSGLKGTIEVYDRLGNRLR